MCICNYSRIFNIKKFSIDAILCLIHSPYANFASFPNNILCNIFFFFPRIMLLFSCPASPLTWKSFFIFLCLSWITLTFSERLCSFKNISQFEFTVFPQVMWYSFSGRNIAEVTSCPSQCFTTGSTDLSLSPMGMFTWIMTSFLLILVTLCESLDQWYSSLFGH